MPVESVDRRHRSTPDAEGRAGPIRPAGGFVRLVVLLLGVLLWAPAPSEASLAGTLQESETSFCRLVQERGIRTAFLAVLDTEAVVFRPGPVNARDWYAARDSIAGILSWQPQLVEASGDLGFTTGPWQFRRGAPNEEPVAFGDYLSVWRRMDHQPPAPPETRLPGSPGPDAPERADGARDGWRLLIDLGVGHRNPAPPASDAGPVLNPDQPRLDARPDTALARSATADAVETARAALLDTDRRFCAELAARAAAEVYARRTAPLSRLLREGHLPAIGAAQIRALLTDSTRTIAWVPRQAGISGSLDLGYTWGDVRVIRADQAADTLPAHYLRTWRLDPRSGDWKLLVECVPEQP
jgi:hypothetical protein